MSDSDNGWAEHKMYVTETLKDIKNTVTNVSNKVDNLSQEVANMKGSQHTITALVSGGISAITAGLLEYFHRR